MRESATIQSGVQMPLASPSGNKTDELFGGSLSESDQKYLKDLTLLSMSSLQKEPQELEKERNRLQTEIEGIAVHNYRGFIETSRAISDAHQSIVDMRENLDGLVDTLPEFNEKCAEFTSRSQEIQQSQILNRTMLEKELELSELLEIPMLMNACARHGLFEEALDLEAYARTLLERYDVPILHSIVQEINRTTHGILQQLREQLRGQLQLPTCLRVVSYLRRLGLFEEQELRAEFLRSRNAWITSVLDNLGTPDHAYEYLSRVIDANRVHLFEVITQYRAIFVDDTSTTEDSEASDKGLLFYWVHCRVSELLDTIDRILALVKDGALLANVLEQAMYCGLSLSRVGSDLRPRLPAIFSKHILALFQEEMADAVREFDGSLSEFEWHISASDLTSLGLPITKGVVVEYPPLAVLGNAFIASFNVLRHCCPMSTCTQIVKEVESVFMAVSRSLHQIKLLCLQQPAGAGSPNGISSAQAQDQELVHQPANATPALLEAAEAVRTSTAAKGGDPVAMLAKALVNHLLPHISKLLAGLYQQDRDLLDIVGLSTSFSGLYTEENKIEQDPEQDALAPERETPEVPVGGDIAAEDSSAANGDPNTADGDSSTADGDSSTANGDPSTADGDSSTANGDYTCSTADGDSSTTDGDSSAAHSL